MKKRTLALLLTVILLVPCFASCSDFDKDYKGPYLQMYLGEQVYDLDPINAYNNTSAVKIMSLLFAGLFKLDENGNVVNDLVGSCSYVNDDIKEEYKLTLILNETYWDDGSQVSAENVVYTFKRILKAKNTNDAAALLFDIKNARAIKNSDVNSDGNDVTIDDLGVQADKNRVTIFFENRITEESLERFKMNMTSPALYPLREDKVEGKVDWAKLPATICCSGPFILRKAVYEEGNGKFIIERNSYYYRNREKDAVDKYVTPFRIIIDYSKSAEEQLSLYEAGAVVYLSEIALAKRAEYASQVKLTDTLSTLTYYFNQNALVASTKAGEENGFALFSIANVRKALSLAIDRNAIAEKVVYAKAATGLVPLGCFETTKKDTTFRSVGGDLIATTANNAQATSLLSEAGIVPGNYSFAITVRQGDVVHIAVANEVAAAWNALGFNVSVRTLSVEGKKPGEVDPGTGEVNTDIRDDLFTEAFTANDFEVIAVDLIAKSPDAYSLLAPFALGYTGRNSINKGEYDLKPHFTGYSSTAYNTLIDEATNAGTNAERAASLHDAEELLVADMVAMPIVFSQDAFLTNDELVSNIKLSYYGFSYLDKVNLKDWEDYLATYALDQY